jgi:hypothetical protein
VKSWDLKILNTAVGCFWVEAEDVEHFAHTATDAWTIGGLDHGGVEVAGDMGLTTRQVVVAVEDDFGQSIDFFPVMLSLFMEILSMGE